MALDARDTQHDERIAHNAPRPRPTLSVLAVGPRHQLECAPTATPPAAPATTTITTPRATTRTTTTTPGLRGYGSLRPAPGHGC
eukprot:scaffold36285_cov119-Isochrysis_galbana.AAC.13